VSQVAVIVPVRNGAGAIGACLSRVLDQTRRPDEVIVVDNGSSDGTAAVAAAAGVRVVPEPVPGVYRARNTGWRSSDADLLAFTDADCEPERDWLERLLAPLSDPTVAGVGGEASLGPPETGVARWAVERSFLSQRANFEHPFLPFAATANAAWRRSALEAVGGFEELFLSGGDTDLSWRVQAFAGGRLVYEPDATVTHRFARRVSDVTSRARRYAGGHAVMAVRWSRWPGFRAAQGSLLQRTRAVWLLPFRLPYRALARTDLAVPVIDALFRVNYEIGLVEGRRRAHRLGVEPLPGPPGTPA
jgi:glycosyltransferase involved in cell wall biosynthesis